MSNTIFSRMVTPFDEEVQELFENLAARYSSNEKLDRAYSKTDIANLERVRAPGWRNLHGADRLKRIEAIAAALIAIERGMSARPKRARSVEPGH